MAANGVVAPKSSDTMTLLAASSLWVEWAQLSSFSSGYREGKLDWKLFWGALLGLTLGSGMWYSWNWSAPFAFLGAYGGAFCTALFSKQSLVDSHRRALSLVERGLCGLVLKLCFCGVLLLSFTK